MNLRDKKLYILLAALLLTPGLLVGWMDRPDKPAAVQEVKTAKTVAVVERVVPAEPGYYRADVPLDRELQEALHKACQAHGVEVELALGLIHTESRFDKGAVSAAGCYGLMQLNPAYFPSGLSPEENIEAGTTYLGALLERYGDTGAALCAYHDGHDTGRRGYANAVLEAAEKWR